MIVMMSTTMKVIDDEDAVDGHVIDDIDETGDDNVNDDGQCPLGITYIYLHSGQLCMTYFLIQGEALLLFLASNPIFQM